MQWLMIPWHQNDAGCWSAPGRCFASVQETCLFPSTQQEGKLLSLFLLLAEPRLQGTLPNLHMHDMEAVSLSPSRQTQCFSSI